MQPRQRPRQRHGGAAGIELRHQRPRHLRAADFAERLGDRLGDQRPRQEGYQRRHGAGVSDPRQRVDGGKHQKDVVAGGDGGQPLDGVRGAQPAKRFERVEADVRILVVERAHQRRDRAVGAITAKRQRRLDAQIRVPFLEQRRQRHGDVDVGRREDLQHAAEHVEVTVLPAQRLDHRLHDIVVAMPRQLSNRGAARLPVAGAERGGKVALAIHARRHVLDCRDDPNDTVAVLERPERHALLHAREVRRRCARGTRKQVMVKRRGQDLDLARGQDLTEAHDHPARLEIRNDVGE